MSERGEKVKLGLAGYDLWPHSIAFCQGLEGSEVATISAVWDEDPKHRERLRELTGAEAYADLDEFCAADFEGAVITARTSLRRDIATALARAGKHVLSDKPMAMSVAECEEIVHACEEAGVVLMGGYNFRFWRVWPLMKQVMASGDLGAPVHLYYAYNTGMVPRSEWEETYDSDWTDPRVTPGGAWLTHADHGIDLARWLFETEFTEVRGEMRRLRYPQYEVEDYGVAHCLLANGATALIQSDGIAPEPRLDAIVICENGGMSYSIHPQAKLRVWGAESLGAEVVEYAIAEEWTDAIGRMTEAFAEALRSGAPPPISGEDNLRVMEVVEAAYRSAREDRALAISLTATPGGA